MRCILNRQMIVWSLFLLAGGTSLVQAADVSLDPSNRYYRNNAGTPVFLIGYYDWAAVAPGTFIDHPSEYATMIQQGAPYKINYIRISLGVNRMTSSTNPPSWNNQPTPVPFAYTGNPAKANLDQWDTTFWNGLQSQCALAQQNGVIVHVAFFDGVELRDQGGASYGYNNTYWNPSNQSAVFYPAGYYGDSAGAFYRVNDFNNNTGIGKYQRMLIAKTITETAAYNNVLYEIGNELLGSDVSWNTAVFNYIKTLTSRPVTQVGGGVVPNINGYDDHVGDTSGQVKTYVASFVGNGFPAWIDPDGPGLSDENISSDELRRAAWYCFAGGAAMWGGFTVDYWSFGHGFNSTTTCYYNNVQSFIQDSGVQFWNMVPHHELIGNNGNNSCIANPGTEYVVYVRSDASVTVDLTAVSGTRPYRLFDPKTNTWSTQQTVSGGAVRTFNKSPLLTGADDWVVYIGNGNGGFAGGACSQEQAEWGTLGTQQSLGNGVTPGLATDSLGNIHTVFMNAGAIYYRKGNSSAVFDPAEQIPVPQPDGPGDYNSPHVVCDGNGVPHVVFKKDWYPSTSKCCYTNRVGGSWKTPVLAFNGLLVMYPRLLLIGSNAFVCASTGDPTGTLARFSNLSGTPQLDTSVGTYLDAPYPVKDSTNRLFVAGRNSANGHYIQEYNLNLGTIGGGFKISTNTPNKTGEPTAAVIDVNNLIHVIGNCGATGIDPESSSDVWYNKSQDGALPAQGSILGLTGSGWFGDSLYPHMAIDASGKIYLAYRSKDTGEGKISIVNNGQFATPATFTTAVTDPDSPIRRRWNCQVAPAPAGGVYVAWDYNNICYLRPVGVGAAASDIFIDMGTPEISSGITNPQNSDGDTTVTSVGGKSCRTNTDFGSGDHYFYFSVSDFFAFQGSKPDLYITMAYYDNGTGALTLEYDSIGPADIPHEYASGGSVIRTNTNTWKEHVFHVTDAYFGNRENAAADFRIGSGASFFLDVMRVGTQAPVPPVIVEVSPDPQTVKVGSPYSVALALVQGYPLPTWSIVQAPAGVQVNASGVVSSWTPLVAELGNHTLEIQATNNQGSDTELWVVRVLSAYDYDNDGDCDTSDFGHLQQCLSGPGIPYAPGCSDADSNADDDVDTFDFANFLPCLVGSNQTPGC